MPTCGAPNKFPPPEFCQRQVKRTGMRCFDHKRSVVGGGKSRKKRPPRPPVWVSRPKPAAQRRERLRYEQLSARQRQRLDETATWLVDLAEDGWIDTVSSRLVDVLDEPTIDRLFKRRRRGDCRTLADTAATLLAEKNRLHRSAGRFGARFARRLGAEPFEEAVVRQFIAKIPIPVLDQKAVAVARALQVLGVLLCLVDGVPLARCPSFIDLSVFETKERAKNILAGALDDWTRIDSRTLTAWSR